jgi:uncharacterized protein involved in exopolysaccharide biosynthesis
MTPNNIPAEAPFTAEEDKISLLDLLQVVVENLRLLVYGPLAAGVLALGVAFVIPPTFTATTLIMPPQQQSGGASALLQSLGGLGAIAGGAAGLKSPNDQYVALLKSTAVADGLIERFKLLERYDEKFKVDARKQLELKSKISSGTKDGLITIDFDDKDPAFAAQVANAYVDELGKLMTRLAVTEAQQRRAFFEKQMLQTKERLTQAQVALESGGVSGSSLKLMLDTSIRPVAEIQAQVTAQEIKLNSMRGYLAETAPEFKQAQTQLAALHAQLTKLQATESPATNGKDAEYVTRYRDFQYYQTLFDLFARQFELAKVDEAKEGALIQVVDSATPPEKKSKPKRGLIAVLASLGSGFALLLYVFVRNAWINAKQNPATEQKIQAIRQSNPFSSKPSI